LGSVTQYMPRDLLHEIHSNTRPTSPELSGYYAEITGNYDNFEQDDYHDHVIREYNRRAWNYGFTGQMITPYDDGFRYVGTGIV